jgi:hypothetical protein
MEKIKVETLEKFAKDNGWMQISELGTPKGRQLVFLSPQGNFVIALYNLNGQEVDQVSGPPPVVMMQGSMPQIRPSFGLPGGPSFARG